MSLLSQCTSGGCGAKIGPGELSQFLQALPSFSHPDLLVGFDASDDAAVYRLNDQQAIISTVDFFSPMVNDPYAFGKIAATNAMSDVYAMGGDVLLALNLVCFPQKMDKAILGEILAGGAEKLKEAGAILCGGHSIYDHEPKYGLSVVGTAHPDKIYRNNTCETGDLLLLTKPLGLGLVMSAMSVDLATPESEKAALATMERLNGYAAGKMKNYSVHACTDITGFGLLVHASEMAGKNHTITLDTSSLPLLPNALNYAEDYLMTAAGQRNRIHLSDNVDLGGISPAMEEVLFDPQTSGGLLISVKESDATKLLDDIKQDDPYAAIIGQITEKENKSIILL